MPNPAGTEILLECETRDGKQETLPLGNPNVGVTLKLYNPSNAIIVNGENMTNLSTGRWRYAYQTTAGSPVGVWTAIFTAQDGSTIVPTAKIEVFELIAP